jgi:hypothetical protein
VIACSGPIGPGLGRGPAGAPGAPGATGPTNDVEVILFKQSADSAASSATAATLLYYFGYARTLTAIYWLPRGTSSQDATNNATILVELYDASNVLVGTVATVTTSPASGGTIASGIPYSLGALTNAAGAVGQRLKISISKGGTGVTVAAAQIELVF